MAINSGMSPEIALMNVSGNSENPWQGLNFANGDKINLKTVGILDPAKVTRCAIKNAVSVAGTLLLTNHSIVHR